MSILVRLVRPEEDRWFLELYHSAIRAIGPCEIPRGTIADFTRFALTDAGLERFAAHRDQHVRLLAELDGDAVGIGMLVPSTCEIRACYVSPQAVRCGVGSAILSEIERIATEHGITFLTVRSSWRAEPFYVRTGYEVLKREWFWPGRGMANVTVRMQKRLNGPQIV